jgi:hypothetical protein
MTAEESRGKPTVSAKRPATAARGRPAKDAGRRPVEVEKMAKNGKADAPDTDATKQKLVRDSFTIPKAEYAVLEGLKERAAHLRRPTKKSELLRAGVAVLNAMSDRAFLAALNGVVSLKTGRPKRADSESG